MTIAWESAGGSDVGRLRKGNEDTLRMDPERGIFLVADGMGGHAAGEVASEIAASTAEGILGDALAAGVAGEGIDRALVLAFQQAYEAIVQYCRANPHTRGMGTTLTVCVIDPSGTARIGHIGDSRVYRLRDGTLHQLTHDHTWVQCEVEAGRLSLEAARAHPLSHILTRVLSEDVEPTVDLHTIDLRPGDLLLLATDGLYNMIDDDAIEAMLGSGQPLTQLTHQLIDAANAAGGSDNVTVVLVGITPAPVKRAAE